MTIKLKINRYQDRLNVIEAVVNAGYRVSIEERKQKGEILNTKIDYYVIIEDKE